MLVGDTGLRALFTKFELRRPSCLEDMMHFCLSISRPGALDF